MLTESDFSVFFATSDSIGDVKTVSDKMDKRLARNFGVFSRDLEMRTRNITVFLTRKMSLSRHTSLRIL
ncbi:MAG: hypothetical protein WB014_00870 [Methanosarcina sp.]